MAVRLKFLLAEKVLPSFSKHKHLMKCVNSIETYYGPSENDFFLDLKSHPSLQVDLAKITDTGQVAEDFKFIKTVDKEKVRFQVNRDCFIKNVLEETVTNVSSIQLRIEEPKKVVIDFSSPNIAKPFHVGHLRSTIIGNFIANINKHFSHKVTRINYLGDWGTQFGLLQYGLKSMNIDMEQLKQDPIQLLYQAYVHANKASGTDQSILEEARSYFANIEKGIEDLGIWKNIREFTVQELSRIYHRLGVHFDEYHWESDYNGKAIEHIIQLMKIKNIIQMDQSGKEVATIGDRNVTVLKSDSSTLYLTRDIAAVIDRFQRYNFDEMLYVVDNSQADHFAALFTIVKKLDQTCGERCRHIKFGRIKGMSTRQGNVVFLNNILDEAKSKMYEKQLKSPNTRVAAQDEDTCDILGTTAVIINDLKQRRVRDYSFEWDKALQSEGDSGIKLQYLHCRLWSLEQNCAATLPTTCDPGYLQEPIVAALVAELAKFDDVLAKSCSEYEACILVNYLFRLSRHVNRAINCLKVKNEEAHVASQRLLLFHASRLVLQKGLEILGTKPLNQM